MFLCGTTCWVEKGLKKCVENDAITGPWPFRWAVCPFRSHVLFSQTHTYACWIRGGLFWLTSPTPAFHFTPFTLVTICYKHLGSFASIPGCLFYPTSASCSLLRLSPIGSFSLYGAKRFLIFLWLASTLPCGAVDCSTSLLSSLSQSLSSSLLERMTNKIRRLHNNNNNKNNNDNDNNNRQAQTGKQPAGKKQQGDSALCGQHQQQRKKKTKRERSWRVQRPFKSTDQATNRPTRNQAGPFRKGPVLAWANFKGIAVVELRPLSLCRSSASAHPFSSPSMLELAEWLGRLAIAS